MSTKLRVHLVSWNTAGSRLNESINYQNLFGFDSDYKYKYGDLPDLFVIGYQELNMFNYTDYLIENNWITCFKSIFAHVNSVHSVQFVKIRHKRELNQLLTVFVQVKHLTFIRNTQLQVIRFGILNVFPNKAAIAFRFDFGNCDICFVSAHLTAHAHNYTRRLYECKLIVDSIKFDQQNQVGPLQHAYTFVSGDLNFRLEQFPIELWSQPVDYSKVPDSKAIDQLLKSDQLRAAQNKNEALEMFQEDQIRFWPTYKYLIDESQMFSTKRKPSYTDRILSRSNSNKGDDKHIKPIKYSSLGEFTQSDHRPVFGIYDLSMKQATGSLAKVNFIGPIVWKSFEDNEIRFSFELLNKESDLKEVESLQLKPNSWDWIGLYRSDFVSLDDYEGFVFVESQTTELAEEAIEQSSSQVDLNTTEDRIFTTMFTYINLEVNDYVLLYIRHDGSVWGQSKSFKL